MRDTGQQGVMTAPMIGSTAPVGARRRAQPSWIDPMLATLTERRFSNPEWIYERKLDGVRCLAFKANGSVRLYSRNRNSLDATYPELVTALQGQAADEFIVDGEIVAFEGGEISFARLQQRMGLSRTSDVLASKVAVYLYLFDIPALNGQDLSRVPLRGRKSLLRRSIAFGGRLRFTTHRNGGGEALLSEACRRGWEGLIAKRANSSYQQARSRDWLKFKCTRRQECVIGGYTEPQGSRTGFGALLVGYHDDTGLRYAGKVGTGFDDRLLASLAQRLAKLARATCPFVDRVREPRTHWVDPVLVAEIGFAEWTRDGRLRHPRFLGLRADMDAHQVIREVAAE